MFRGSLPSCKNTSAPFGTYFLKRGTQFSWKNWLSVIIVPISLERLWMTIPSFCKLPIVSGNGFKKDREGILKEGIRAITINRRGLKLRSRRRNKIKIDRLLGM